MRLLALDIETTHHRPEDGCIVEIAAIVFDSETGKKEPDVFEALINPGTITGNPYCLAMHQLLFQRMRASTPNLADTMRNFRTWLMEKGFNGKNKATPVGFNVASFDVRWLKGASAIIELPISHRSIELGTLLMRTGKDMNGPIPSSEAVKLLGTAREVHHTALADCEDAIALYTLAMRPFLSSLCEE